MLRPRFKLLEESMCEPQDYRDGTMRWAFLYQDNAAGTKERYRLVITRVRVNFKGSSCVRQHGQRPACDAILKGRPFASRKRAQLRFEGDTILTTTSW